MLLLVDRNLAAAGGFTRRGSRRPAGSRQVLPSPETLVALEGYTLLHTDQNGWIGIETDGEQMWVGVERK